MLPGESGREEVVLTLVGVLVDMELPTKLAHKIFRLNILDQFISMSLEENLFTKEQ
jgi:hypothetical protein